MPPCQPRVFSPAMPGQPSYPQEGKQPPIPAAFAELAPVLLTWAHARLHGALRRHLEPEDLVQEVGLRACATAEHYDPARGSPRQWLFGIANRVWLELLREVARDPGGPLRRSGGDSQLPDLKSPITTITRRIVLDERHRHCYALIDQLEAEDRKLLVAIGLEGLSHLEAAALLGIHEAACRKRWQRLREQLSADACFQQLLA